MLEASFWSDKSAMASRPYGRQSQGTSRGCLRMYGRRSNSRQLFVKARGLPDFGVVLTNVNISRVFVMLTPGKVELYLSMVISLGAMDT